MYTFKDLDHKEHPHHMGGTQARLDFPNGYGVSVIRTQYSYGSEQGLYELAAFKDGYMSYEPEVVDGDVLGHLTPEKVTEVMKELQEL